MKLKHWPYIFTLPYFLLYFLFGIFPIFFTLYISFTKWNIIGAKEFIGFSNYLFLFNSSAYFFKAIWNTVIIMLEYLPLQILLGLGFAALIHAMKTRLKRFFQLAIFSPYITTPVAIGIIFALIFDWRTGLINTLLIELGILKEGINWLGNPVNARLIVGLTILWKNLGYVMMVYLAGISGIPNELNEAACIDGATSLQTFYRIIIPMLRPITLFLVITSIIGGFQLFEEPMLLLSGWTSGQIVVGGPERSCLTAIWYLYDIAFGGRSTIDYGLGAAIAYGLFIIIAIFSFLGFKFINRGEETV